jgi:hypothetical protein
MSGFTASLSLLCCLILLPFLCCDGFVPGILQSNGYVSLNKTNAPIEDVGHDSLFFYHNVDQLQNYINVTLDMEACKDNIPGIQVRMSLVKRLFTRTQDCQNIGKYMECLEQAMNKYPEMV